MSLPRFGLVALGLSALGCAPPPPPAPAVAPGPVTAPALPPPSRCLSVVGWNDLHGQLSPDDPVVSTGRLPAGGVVALADDIDDLRHGPDTVVTLDAGDLFTGPLASSLAEGAPVIEAYRILGVDAVAVGNHEFDFGPVGADRITAAPGATDEAGADGPRGALLARMKEASFPFLAANVTAGGATPAWPNFRPSTHVKRDGFDVGVVGYTTRDTPTTTLPPNIVGLDFVAGAAERVGKEIRDLRAAGSYPIVLLAHASLEGSLPQSLYDSAEHKGEIPSLLAALGPDQPDLVIAGHRHAWMVGRIHGVPIVSSDQHGVGFTRSRFCPSSSGKLALAGIDRHTALWAGAPRTELGARVAAAVAPWEAKVKPIGEAFVADLPKECSARAASGVALADQVARATAERVSAAAPVPAGVPVVGLTNIGGLRAPLPAGRATFADLFTVFPFENTVAVCGTTRGGLRHLIDNALRKESSRERFPLGISGAKLRVRRGPDGGLTFVSLAIEGERSTKDDAPVWIALSDFILYGGDSLLKGVTCSPKAASQARVRDAWRDLLVREKRCDGPSTNVLIDN